MIRVLRLLGLLILWTVPSFASTEVVFTWTEASFATVPACTSATPALTANCITGANIYNVSNSGTQTKVGSLTYTDNPTATTVETLTITNYPFLGTDSAVATTTYLDQSGAAQETPAGTPATFLYTPSAPVLKGTVQ